MANTRCEVIDEMVVVDICGLGGRCRHRSGDRLAAA
jgi:hypothetical protein